MNPTLNFQDWTLLLHRIANIANERPLGVKNLTEDIISPLTPNQLLIGRNHGQVTCPDALPDDYYANQKSYADCLLQSWWNSWFAQVFDSLLPYQSYRDSKRCQNLEVGDVCLLKYENKIKASYRYCKVVETFKEEGIVRTVRIKLGGRELKHFRCKDMTVGVQRLVLVTPVESIEREIAQYSD